MEIAKVNIFKILVVFYLVLLPFGQIPGFLTSYYFDLFFKLHFYDAIVLMFSILFALKQRVNLTIFFKRNMFLTIFIIISLLTYLHSFFIFDSHDLVRGFLYLLRFMAYILFYIGVFYEFRRKREKRFLLGGVTLAVFFTAVFGWVQYFILPDLRSLKYFGWDDHYYRLVSSFLDPGYAGMFFLTGYIIVNQFDLFRRSINFFLNLFFTISIAFTYSRASYLAFVFSTLFFYLFSRKKHWLIGILVFLLSIATLPVGFGGEGVNLHRTNSINQRWENYKDAIYVIKKHPLFGVGFNNVCSARVLYFNDTNKYSNSCNGFDNSLLFLLSAGGVALFIGYIGFIYEALIKTTKNQRKFLAGFFLAFLIHSLSANSIFYAPFMGVFAIIGGIFRENR